MSHDCCPKDVIVVARDEELAELERELNALKNATPEQGTHPLYGLCEKCGMDLVLCCPICSTPLPENWKKAAPQEPLAKSTGGMSVNGEDQPGEKEVTPAGAAPDAMPEEPLTKLLANAFALVDQRDALRAHAERLQERVEVQRQSKVAAQEQAAMLSNKLEQAEAKLLEALQIPREPTQAMLSAGYAAAAFPRDPEICVAMWKAMWDAALAAQEPTSRNGDPHPS